MQSVQFLQNDLKTIDIGWCDLYDQQHLNEDGAVFYFCSCSND